MSTANAINLSSLLRYTLLERISISSRNAMNIFFFQSCICYYIHYRIVFDEYLFNFIWIDDTFIYQFTALIVFLFLFFVMEWDIETATLFDRWNRWNCSDQKKIRSQFWINGLNDPSLYWQWIMYHLKFHQICLLC